MPKRSAYISATGCPHGLGWQSMHARASLHRLWVGGDSAGGGSGGSENSRSGGTVVVSSAEAMASDP